MTTRTLAVSVVAVCAALLTAQPSVRAEQPASAADPSGQANSQRPVEYYPPQAKKEGKAGDATISCTVTDHSTLQDCKVLAEDPPGYGFGESALRIAQYFKMKPESTLKAGDAFTTTIKFRLN